MNLEAVILTGGASRRMGQDKASLPIDGIPQAQRIVDELRAKGLPVTVLGRVPIEGAAFLADAEEFAGPAAALARFHPTADAVFVASCDLPLFDIRIVDLLLDHLGERLAVAPIVDTWRQPLCALYRSTAFGSLTQVVAEGYRCPMRWLDRLDPVLLDEEALLAVGIDPRATLGANTPEELSDALRHRRTDR
ncbi:MAG: molybdenum cofactor guanylyltransferase [Fimbriimonas sp.]